MASRTAAFKAGVRRNSLSEDVQQHGELSEDAAWASVSVYDNNTLAIKKDGTLWGWGWNCKNQLGIGPRGASATPVQVGQAKDWACVSVGCYHALAIQKDGTLWSWGSNYCHAIGVLTDVPRYEPAPVGNESDWASVYAGDHRSVAVKTDGTLWEWGFCAEEREGLAFILRPEPVQVLPPDVWKLENPFERIDAAVAGARALFQHWPSTKMGTSDGLLDIYWPREVGSTAVERIRAAPEYRVVEDVREARAAGNNRTQAFIAGTRGSLSQCDALAIGPRDSGCGDSDGGTMGRANHWVLLSAGGHHTMAIKSDGTLWGWGRNEDGELGDSTMVFRCAPVQIGDATDWASVHAGDRRTVAVRMDGSLWEWGLCADSRDGSLSLAPSPVQVLSNEWWKSAVPWEVLHVRWKDEKRGLRRLYEEYYNPYDPAVARHESQCLRELWPKKPTLIAHTPTDPAKPNRANVRGQAVGLEAPVSMPQDAGTEEPGEGFEISVVKSAVAIVAKAIHWGVARMRGD